MSTLGGYSVFNSMPMLAVHDVRPLPRIPRADYERFCYGWLFDALRGLTFGQAFCREFSVTDMLLLYTTGWDEERTQRYIERTGYIEG